MRPRIGIDAHGLAVARTGVGNYIAGLIGGAARVAPREDVALYLHHEPREALPFRTVRVSRSPLWTTVRLPLHFARHGAPRAMLYPAHSHALFGGGASVLTIHDLAFERYPEHFTARDRLRLRALTRHGVRRADRLIAVSHATRADLTELLGVAGERITVVHHGRDERFVPASPEAVAAVRRRHGLARPYLLMVGTLQARKNHATVIRALPLLHAAGVEVELVIAGGTGWLFGETMKLVGDLGMGEFVRFLGYVADDELPALYTGAEAAALVSLYEGFGMPVLESLGCGTPTLIAGVSSLPEVGGDAVLAVADPLRVDEVAEGLRRLVADTALRAELRERAPGQLARFSWEKAARTTLDLLNEIA